MVGTIIKSKNFGVARVIDNGYKYGYFKVQFKNTGNIDEFRTDAIKKGEIRDKYAPTLLGIGIIGNIKTRGKYKKYYSLWRNMITRCYSKSNSAYYGKVEVCKEWLVFEAFYEDIKNVDGWNEDEFENGNLVLDKDIKQPFFNHKIYSKNTCTWTTQDINSTIQDAQQREFIGVSENGDTFKSRNISDAARKIGSDRRQVSAVLHGRFKTTKGWKFHYIDKEIV